MSSVSSASGVYTQYYTSRRSALGKSETDAHAAGEPDESVSSWPRGRGDESNGRQILVDESKKVTAVDGVFAAELDSQLNNGAAPESQISSDALDVLLQLKPQAGVALTLGAAEDLESRTATIVDLYADIDAFGGGPMANMTYMFSGSNSAGHDGLTRTSMPQGRVVPISDGTTYAKPRSGAAEILGLLADGAAEAAE